MSTATPSAEMLHLMSERFRALGEPGREQMLYKQQGREVSVNELVDETGLGQANVSKHLQVLHTLRFVKRRKAGLFVFYALCDRATISLCNSVCRRVEAQLEAQQRLLGA
jgi:DNA-binding transcriptional ArsR family regulator